jgi:hypothetical protein
VGGDTNSPTGVFWGALSPSWIVNYILSSSLTGVVVRKITFLTSSTKNWTKTYKQLSSKGFIESKSTKVHSIRHWEQALVKWLKSPGA